MRLGAPFYAGARQEPGQIKRTGSDAPVKLWNDYEGQVIAESYPLRKLLWPEGRSAFFQTSAEDGSVEVIRITESLNDEQEMLERWRQVSEVQQPNLVEIRTFGATTFDGVPLTYALMEATDGSLAEILRERPLTAVETMQVATSVMAALGALHAIGLVHEHIEPASILATGEVVKLRSDCVRACAEDPEFPSQTVCHEVRRDVQDLAVLLMQCLTLERQWTSALRFPAPFDQVIRHGVEGTWGLAEMERALRLPAESPLARAEMPPAAAEVLPVLAEVPTVPAEMARQAQRPAAVRVPEEFAAAKVVDAQASGVRIRVEPEVRARTTRRLHLRRLVTTTVSRDGVPGSLFLIGVVAVMAVLLMWFFAARAPVPLPPGIAAVPSLAQPFAVEPPASDDAGAVARKTNAAPAAATTPQPGWHVIAFTYLHEGQAAAKAATIARLHPGLAPKVFAPAGRSPYFVALGDGMSESEAAVMLRTARRDGLPRDTFIRLYRSR